MNKYLIWMMSCASVDSNEYFDYVRAVNIKDFDPYLDTSYDVNLLDSMNAHCNEEMDPTHNPRALDTTQTSRSPRTDPSGDEDIYSLIW
jgi:hypothetical protein